VLTTVDSAVRKLKSQLTGLAGTPPRIEQGDATPTPWHKSEAKPRCER
jgi:hypothetical protein